MEIGGASEAAALPAAPAGAPDPPSPDNSSVSSVKKRILDAREFEGALGKAGAEERDGEAAASPIPLLGAAWLSDEEEDDEGSGGRDWEEGQELPVCPTRGLDCASEEAGFAASLREEALKLSSESASLRDLACDRALSALSDMDRALQDLQAWHGTRRQQQQQQQQREAEEEEAPGHDSSNAAEEALAPASVGGLEAGPECWCPGAGGGRLPLGWRDKDEWLAHLRAIARPSPAHQQVLLPPDTLKELLDAGGRGVQGPEGQDDEEGGGEEACDRLRGEVEALRLSALVQEARSSAGPPTLRSGNQAEEEEEGGQEGVVLQEGAALGGQMLELETELRLYSQDLDLLLRQLDTIDSRTTTAPTEAVAAPSPPPTSNPQGGGGGGTSDDEEDARGRASDAP